MRCYHCTEEVLDSARWQVEFESATHDVCCAGCQAVMQAIVDAGLGDYYRFRSEPAQFGVIPDDLATRLDELAVFDEPEISERYLQHVDSAGHADLDDRQVAGAGEDATARAADLVDLNLSVEGLRCGACVWVLERSVGSLPGVSRASVNFSSARATIRFDASRLKLSDILRRLAQVGYQGVPFDAREREQALKRESRVFMQRLFIAGIATMQVMMYALPAYLSGEGEIDPAHEQLMRWASLVLTTPVMLYSALPFLKGAWRDVLRRRPGMDVPVTIGIVAAYLASVWATLTGTGEIYFDSVAMFVFLLLGARYLEWAARRRAMRAVDDISLAAPETAQRYVGDVLEVVPALRLDVDDLILVNNGERVPVDAVVHEGHSAVNNALVTGESVPVAVSPGDVVPGGALLTGAPIRFRVLRRQAASTLSVIDRLIDRGASEKPPTVTLTDRIATIFISVLLIFASLVWLIWMQLDASRAATTAIAVLVVSCPCALSMATPAAMAAATGDLLRKRLLVTRGHALEALAQVSDVVFDKTGTLTTGKPVVTQVHVDKGQTPLRVLQLAGALEQGSTHPHAHALRQAQLKAEQEDGVAGAEAANSRVVTTEVQLDAMGKLRQLGMPASRLMLCAGHGVAAELESQGVDKMGLYLGSALWCGLSEEQVKHWHAQDGSREQAASEVYLVLRPLRRAPQDDGDGTQAIGRQEVGHAVKQVPAMDAPAAQFDTSASSAPVQVLARFLLEDDLRQEAPELIRQLQKKGLKVHLLSGDRLPAVQQAAERLGITHYAAAMTPADKQAAVAALQKEGATVLMVGDGINDAPVLASADVSLAAGDATALARTAADVISLLPGLEGLQDLLEKSVQTLRIVRQNLLWAALYNLTAIPLAALGLVPPWAAAIGMASSSLLVVANAQRLWTRGGLSADAHPSPRARLWNRFSF